MTRFLFGLLGLALGVIGVLAFEAAWRSVNPTPVAGQSYPELLRGLAPAPPAPVAMAEAPHEAPPAPAPIPFGLVTRKPQAPALPGPSAPEPPPLEAVIVGSEAPASAVPVAFRPAETGAAPPAGEPTKSVAPSPPAPELPPPPQASSVTGPPPTPQPQEAETKPPAPPTIPPTAALPRNVDVYLSARELEAGKPFLAGVVFAESAELGGKKFLKFCKPDNPDQYWLLDATQILAARFQK